MKIGIVGSGQASVMAALALVENGIRPIILDVGETLSEKRQVLVDEAIAGEDYGVKRKKLSEILDQRNFISENSPRKKVFGSDFLFADDRHVLPTTSNTTRATQSTALGGFSSGWGGAILFPDSRDIENWPISQKELEKYYQKITTFFPLSGKSDGLDKTFPSRSNQFQELKLDNVSASFLKDLKNYSELSEQDFEVGQARLALASSACDYCSLCLVGCPKNLLHSAENVMQRMIKKNEVDYVKNCVVKSFRERRNKVEVQTLELNGKVAETHQFDKLLIGAGAIGSSRIVLESCDQNEKKLELLDCEKVAIPIIRYRAEQISWPTSNTYSSIFLETKVPGLLDNWVHMQVSGMNEYILKHLKMYKDFDLTYMGYLAKPLLGRLLIGFSSFHSSYSNKLLLNLNKVNDRSILKIEVMENDIFPKLLATYFTELGKIGKNTKTMFLPRFSRRWESGITGHFGGSMPMTAKPKKWNETDKWGKLYGKKHTYIIDASTFPSIPGTTVAGLIMANAFRIADYVSKK